MIADPVWASRPHAARGSAVAQAGDGARLADRVHKHPRVAARHPRRPRATIAEPIAVGIRVRRVRGVGPKHLGRVQQAVVVGVRIERVGGDRTATGHLVPVVAPIVVGIPVIRVRTDRDLFAVIQAVAVGVGITDIPQGIVLLFTVPGGGHRAHGTRMLYIRGLQVDEVLVVGVGVLGTSIRDHARRSDRHDRTILDSIVVGVVVDDERTLSISRTAGCRGERAQAAPCVLLGIEQVVIIGIDVERIGLLIERPLRPCPPCGDQLIGIHQCVVVRVLIERIGPGDVHLFVIGQPVVVRVAVQRRDRLAQGYPDGWDERVRGDEVPDRARNR